MGEVFNIIEELLIIEKYRCRYYGKEFTEVKEVQEHNNIKGHLCDAIPKLPLEYKK